MAKKIGVSEKTYRAMRTVVQKGTPKQIARMDKGGKELGWKQIKVRMMDTRDAEHELNVEISENDVRKGFTKSERVDYMKRLLRIEQAKAKERQTLGEKSHEGGRSDEITAEQFGVSSNTMRKEIAIADNKDLLDPSDFAETQEVSNALIAAEQRIGELLLAIPKQSGMRTDLETSSEHSDEVKTKRQTIEEMGYNRQDANDYEQMAKHPDVVKKVKGHR